MKKTKVTPTPPPHDVEKDKREKDKEKEDSDGVYRSEDAGALPVTEDLEEAKDEA